MKLRLPADLKAKVEESAKANNRSMNSEIVSALQSHYEEVKFRETMTNTAVIPEEKQLPFFNDFANLLDDLVEGLFKKYEIQGRPPTRLHKKKDDNL